MKNSFDIIVVGGGAAGFFGALAAAEARPRIRIAILERGNRPLAKVLISGGGRCNVTHACYDPRDLVQYYPRGARELLGPFTRFQPADTAAWFEQRGVKLKTEADGRIFPTTDRSQTIVDCLMGEADRLGVQVLARSGVRSVTPNEAGFTVQGGFGTLHAETVLLAPGGNAEPIYRSAAEMGHTIIPPVPSLFTFNIDDPRIRELPGIAVPCEAVLYCGGQEFHAAGPILITHWGISGPAVLKLSAWGARALAETGYNANLEINWQAGENADSAYEALRQFKAAQPRSRLITQDPFGKLPVRLWRRLALAAGVPEDRPMAEISNKTFLKLADQITRGRFEISGKGVFKEEFVTCGGVALNEVNFRTMESRLQSGLYFAGEVLDIDGLTGGFNFQTAWTTGWLAGQAMGHGQ